MFEVVGIVHEEAQITLPLLVDFVDDCVNVVKVEAGTASPTFPFPPIQPTQLIHRYRFVDDRRLQTLQPPASALEQSLLLERGFELPPLPSRF
ncbi:hypothetical protein JHK82_048072 [Glycine max]|nr:hypothetical protein JHK86_047948 [Glycine max]KAG4943911.1 hypothetical protein JHK85_048557 [Glycine max]KAG5098218.1 hypothetical protein JHK82_048072 [Glycine max]KAG5103006.1 hypothetical protein JHK84_047975 [Glycine max]